MSCNLKCGRCTAQTAKGTQCRNRVCIGVDICHAHRKSKLGLVVKTSTLPNAGKGLFTTKELKKKRRLHMKYQGDILTPEQNDERHGASQYDHNAYGLQVGDSIIDASCKRGLMSLANGSKSKSTSNAEFTKSGYVRTTKKIPANKEILVHYGKDYFKSAKYHKHFTGTSVKYKPTKQTPTKPTKSNATPKSKPKSKPKTNTNTKSQPTTKKPVAIAQAFLNGSPNSTTKTAVATTTFTVAKPTNTKTAVATTTFTVAKPTKKKLPPVPQTLYIRKQKQKAMKPPVESFAPVVPKPLQKLKKGKRKKLSLNQMAQIWDNPADHVDVYEIQQGNLVGSSSGVGTYLDNL